MKLARILSLLTGIVFACHFSAALAEPITDPAGSPVATGLETAVVDRGLSPTQNGVLIKASPSSATDEIAGTRTLTLTLPSGTDNGTLKIVLNGKNVTSRFSATSCNDGVCETATLTAADGLIDVKNVLYAVAKKSDGTLVSSRLRFEGGTTPTTQARSAIAHSSSAASVSALPTNSTFLPPSVGFSVAAGGWQSGKAWVTVGTQQSYPDASYSCSGSYTAIVLDRKTLVEKTAAPESSPQCLANGTAVSNYLKGLSSSDLVILGTKLGQNTDAPQGAAYFDTNAIGGTAYNCNSSCTAKAQSQEVPLGYLIIGAGGAASGSAYENYATSPAYESFGSFATGLLEEDANGNYNYQSSNAVEYATVPNDASNNNQTTITLNGTASFSRYLGYNWPNKLVFYSPANATNGFWLLSLRRDNLDFVSGENGNFQNCTSLGNNAKQQTDMTSCGQFFPTGSTDSGTAGAAYTNLLSALNVISFNDLVFLISVGNAVNPNYTGPSGLAYDTNLGPIADMFGQKLETYGGTPGQILSLYQPGSAYTLLTCFGCGNSLTGHTILSTTISSQQGQTGVVHGLLLRNINGLYWSGQASQESQQQLANSEGADFTLSKIGSQQMVEWPELGATLLPNATSVAGQVAAYHYLSYQLVTQYYILGAQGNYLDDIHFYFTGSNNTYLDYHTFNPVNLPFPDPSSSCFAWPDPVTNTTLPCFTPNDFAAVASQVSTEIVDLDNILQFMVTGSTNMKDIVADGNGSAALALIGAGSAVQGSNLQPPPATPVQVSSSGILSLFSSVVNLGLQSATDGLVSEGDLAGISEIGSTIADMFDLSSSVAGGYTSGGTTALPNPQFQESIAIATLANSGLQQQLTAGFDTELDNILGDWGKLSVLGPMITNSNDPAFYTPNQAAQNAAVVAFGQAAQRSFYMSLLPLSYSVQYYPSWFSDNTETPPNPPNMGSAYNNNGSCNHWYPTNETSVWPLISTYHPTFFGSRDPWQGPNPSSIDYYIIASQTVNNFSKSDQSISFLDTQVSSTLFSASGLNMPLDPFVMPHGPMASVFWDATVKGFDGFPADQTTACDSNDDSSDGLGGTGPVPNNPYLTSTSLIVPPSAVLGDSVALQAKVTSSAGVPTGTVSFDMGSMVLGTASLDSTGTAKISTTAMALGSNSITAYYLVNAPYYASQSDPASVEVYANSPSVTLTLSTSSIPITYGTESSPITLGVTSMYGLAGTLGFSCTGMPVGMTCNFSPAQASITAGSNMSTSFTVTSTATQTAGVPRFRGIGAILFSVSLISLWRIRRGRRNIPLLFCLLLVSVVSLGGLLGCNGGSSGSQSLQETGSKTVLVTASSGSITRTIPLVLNIQ